MEIIFFILLFYWIALNVSRCKKRRINILKVLFGQSKYTYIFI